MVTQINPLHIHWIVPIRFEVDVLPAVDAFHDALEEEDVAIIFNQSSAVSPWQKALGIMWDIVRYTRI